MKIVKIIPTDGRIIPQPWEPYRPVPPEGMMVEFPGPQSYWVRRINEGVARIAEKTAKKRGKK